MIGALIRVRFRALFAGLTRQSRTGKKKTSPVLFIVLYGYIALMMVFLFASTFSELAGPYHQAGLDWLYFAMAGLIGLAMSVLGSVFSTQSQLYEAKDNGLLLSMPIPARLILLSRMVPLLALNLVFSALVMVPAFVVYANLVEFNLLGFCFQLLSLLGVVLLSQAIACLLGWLLHLLLSKMNKSVASMLYMIVFLGIYFAIYSQAQQILATMASGGTAIAAALQSWVWPLYAMGRGSLGAFGYCLGFLAVCAAAFALVYWVLSRTFLATATMGRTVRRAKKLDWSRTDRRRPIQAITGKEWKKFLGTPVYLTNMGLGLIFTALLPILGLVFRSKLMLLVHLFGLSGGVLTAILCAGLCYVGSITLISTPSVSLEGKNFWILRSMPVSSKTILLGKLRLHLLCCVPLNALSGLVLALAYGCGPINALLASLIPGLFGVLNGVLGLVFGLKWARFDYISEAYPCKQSGSVAAAMFSLWGLVLVLGGGYFLLSPLLSPTGYLALCAGILAVLSFALYRLLLGWGVRKWESL